MNILSFFSPPAVGGRIVRLRCGVWGNCYFNPNPSYSSLTTVARRDMNRTVTTRTTNPAELHRQNVNRTNRLIRPILHLQDHCATLKSPQRMPLPCRNIQRTNRLGMLTIIGESYNDLTPSYPKLH